MGIRMNHHLFLQERSYLSKFPVHSGVGIENKLSSEERNVFCKSTIIIDRTVNL
jgi:hypothetical protein